MMNIFSVITFMGALLINAVICEDTKLDLTLHTGLEYEQEVQVYKGSQFTVQLSGKSGTGYQWLVLP